MIFRMQRDKYKTCDTHKGLLPNILIIQRYFLENCVTPGNDTF